MSDACDKRLRGLTPGLRRSALAAFLAAAAIPASALLPVPALAQSYSFSSVTVEGNVRIEPATIVKLAALPRGEAVTAAALNDAYQRIMGSGLFRSVELIPSGSTLVVRVVENPTISVVSFEGNKRLKDEDLAKIVKSQSRRVYSPATAEQDAAAIADAYGTAGRFAARVEPKIIERPDNRVDLVFEIREGAVSEVERLNFTGNRSFSDRRLRQVLQTKQAGLLRAFIQRDTYIPERLDLDRQLLTDFYRSRGFIDAEVTGATGEFARERDGFFVNFTVREGQQYRFGKITTVSEVEGIDAADYERQVKIRRGVTYSPTAIDNTIARMEEIARRQGATFVTVEPRFTRNEKDGILDVEFALVRGPRIFVERIDIEGNVTTLDQVIRRQFKTVEGDPLNAREIRQAAERIRALGYFANADVTANQGSSPEQVIVDVNVEEKPTGSLGFGLSYGTVQGLGLNFNFRESNFLGRGQTLAVSVATGTSTLDNSITFIEPALLNRDLKLKFSGYYRATENNFSFYSTRLIGVSPAIEFPLGLNSRLELRYALTQKDLFKYEVDAGDTPSVILTNEAAQGALISSAIGYTYSFDNRISGLNPNAKLQFRFGQDFAGLGGDIESVTTTAALRAETKIFNEDVTLRAELEGGALNTMNGNSRVIDRFSGNGEIRGFEPNGIGPRELAATNQDALGGNYYAVLRLDAEFPLGLPEEYGILGGVFADVGSVWGLDDTLGGTIDDAMHLRSSVGVSLLWDTPIGPLRFNFAKALEKQPYDRDQVFDLSVSTQF
ncbi:MAG: outer membrane protein assembly factor BamA [Rhodobacteraceae bacterium]|nr:outer membrane protein assembly factor BamA [Paracoccaceae bacterium]